MGKGDKKSRRGKIILGTYGVRRPRKKAEMKSVSPQEVVPAQKTARESREKTQPEVKETKTPASREHKPKVEKTEKPVKHEKAEKNEPAKTTKEPRPKKEK